MKNKKVLIVMTIIFFAYLFSYILIRKSNTIEEVKTDSCGYNGCTYVYFQQGTPYLIYSPLIYLDKTINRAEFIFTGWKQ